MEIDAMEILLKKMKWILFLFFQYNSARTRYLKQSFKNKKIVEIFSLKNTTT